MLSAYPNESILTRWKHEIKQRMSSISIVSIPESSQFDVPLVHPCNTGHLWQRYWFRGKWQKNIVKWSGAQRVSERPSIAQCLAESTDNGWWMVWSDVRVYETDRVLSGHWFTSSHSGLLPLRESCRRWSALCRWSKACWWETSWWGCSRARLCLADWPCSPDGCGDISAGACSRILPNSNSPYSALEQ